jgi:hypothetical protein
LAERLNGGVKAAGYELVGTNLGESDIRVLSLWFVTKQYGHPKILINSKDTYSRNKCNSNPYSFHPHEVYLPAVLAILRKQSIS